MKKNKFFISPGVWTAFLLFAALIPVSGWAQGVAIGETNATPDPSAMLDVQSLTKGMLVPRMSEANRLSIASPANGLIVYQTSNTPNSRRGYWYYEATEPEWIHLGRGEYVGRVDQEPPGTHDASYTSNINPISEGFSEITWFVSDISTPPAVVVIPEFTTVGTAPEITEYCGPDELTCSAFGRMNFIKVYHPEAAFNGPVISNPPLKANLVHNSCNGALDVNYKYVPNDAPSNYTTDTDEFNSFTVDLCSESPDIGFWMRGGSSNPKSFSFWVDANQDGDFDDPGELIDTRTNLPTGGGNQMYFGSSFAAWNAPISLPVADMASGMSKLRIIVRDNNPPVTDPCYVGDGNTKTYDFDMEVLCGGAGPAFYPNDLNWCNVDNITPFSARVACFDKNGTPTDMRFHYKLVPID